MATIINDENIKKFKECNQDITSILRKWDSPCNATKNALSGPIGSVFAEQYGIGRTAHEKISTLIDILQEMEQTVGTLINQTNTFLDEHAQANQNVY